MAEYRSLSETLGNVATTITTRWTQISASAASSSNPTTLAKKAGQCIPKSMSARAAHMAKSDTWTWVLLTWYLLVGIFSQAVHLAPFDAPWTPSIPVHVQESLFKLCDEKMSRRRVTPVHVRELGSNLHVVCTQERILFNPRQRGDVVHYTTALGSTKVIENPDQALLDVVNRATTPKPR
jgi:hypothetical protein